MNAWLPEASYPCGNFSVTSSVWTKGSIGHAFAVCIYTENKNQVGFFVLHETSVTTEPALGHQHYLLTDVPSHHPTTQRS